MASEVGVSDGLPASAKASWILILIVHGMLAFLLNIANFNAVKEGGPLMMNVVGNVKQVVMIFLSVFLFGNRMTVMGIIGSVICILGSMWYTYGLYRKSGLWVENIKSKSKPAPKEETYTLLPKSASSADDVEKN